MPSRLYHRNLYRFQDRQPSYWEATAGDTQATAAALEAEENCDVAIIGGGYTGLSAAYHLARDYDIDVRVLDAGHIGWGASGRNGGFCCMGGTGVHSLDLLRMVGLEETQAYFRSQAEAVELVRRLGCEEDIDFHAQGDRVLEVAHTPSAFARLQKEHAFTTEQLGMPSDLLSAGAFAERYYASTEVFGATTSQPAFGLHPLRYCRGLAAAAERRGAKLHSFSEVTSWSKTASGRHRLCTNGGALNARKVIFATNGFMPEDLRSEFHARTLPVISAIIVTRPLSDDELAAHRWATQDSAINSRRILNYFRLLPDGRFLFGGRGHSTGHSNGEQETYRRLQSMLAKIWPEWRDVQIDYRWHGLICMTAQLRPTMGQLEDDKSVFFGFGYHGNGVNTATWTGLQLAKILATGNTSEVPSCLLGLGRKYPLPKLRLKYLQAGIGLSAMLDKYR